MKPEYQRIQSLLRQTYLLKQVENLRYLVKKIQSRKKNTSFKSKYPDFALPPEYLVFDANGKIDWGSYKESGFADAKNIIDVIKENSKLDRGKLLEWGCGPGRVIRHIPVLDKNLDVFGSDYNNESIAWCQNKIPNIKFVKNELNPPLPFMDNYFDFIYAISVFTHLSENVCLSWIDELSRVLIPRGLFIVWTNGDKIAERILPEERKKYNEGNFVVRDKYVEGKKMFLSFHPPTWVENILLKDYEILKHYPGGFSGLSQDVWLAKLKK